MTLTRRLAELALRPITTGEADRLRALTAGNVAAALGELGSAKFLVWGLPRSLDSANVAHRLAMQLHARTQDDFYPAGKSHIGAISLASALALAVDAEDRLLDCLAAGYRVTCAVSAAYCSEAQRRGLRPTGVFGPLGGAVTAAIALELDAEHVANAIGLASAMACGTNQSWISGTDEWLIEVGNAARAGVEAALYSRAGASASDVALEGAAGWAHALFDEEGAWSLFGVLDQELDRIKEVASKPYPVSGIAQVPTHLGCTAHGQLGGRFERATITLSADEIAYPGSANRGPFKSRSDALMSIAFCVAAGLHDGGVKIARLDAPNALHAFVDRIDVEPDPAMTRATARLRVVVNQHEIEFVCGADDLLYQNWGQISASAAGLAERSEADPGRVAEAVAILGHERPIAAQLADLLTVRM